MPNHYWVSSPEFMEYGESYRVVECLEAENKTKAKGKYVSLQYKKKYQRDGLFWNIGLHENPFIELKVDQCLCKHGVCNCDIENCNIGLPKSSKWDYCGDCIDEDNMNHLKEDHHVFSEHRCIQNHAEDWA